MQLSTETITPEQATKWLDGNIDNRNVRPLLVREFARDMRAGNWKLTGEAIKFNGRDLLDGQHRLLACIQAQTPFITAVARNVEQSAVAAMDSGAKRSVSDLMRWNGEVDVFNLGATINLAHMWENDAWGINGRPTHAEVLAWLEANPDVRTSVRAVRPVRDAIGGAISPWAALHYRTQQLSSIDSQEFFEGLTVGANLLVGDPILALRQWVANTQSIRRGTRPVARVWLGIGVKAWNYYRTGKTDVHHLRFAASGPRREAFPTAI